MTDLSAINFFFSENPKDTHGETYYRAFIQGGHVTLNRDTVKTNSVAWSLAVSKDYTTKVSGMSDTDLHYEFMDFIVATAVHHSKLDSITRLGRLVDKLEEAKYSTNIRNFISTFNTTFITQHGANNAITAADIMTPAMTTNLENAIIADLHTIAAMPGGYNAFHKDVVIPVIDKLAPDWGLIATPLSPGATQTLLDIHADVLDQIRDKKSAIVSALTALYNDYLLGYDVQTKLKEIGRDTFFMHDVMHIIVQNVYSEIFSHRVKTTRISLIEKEPLMLYNNVYKKWGSLDNDVRSFYESMMDIVELNSRNRVPETEYERLTNLGAYGFNFKKTRSSRPMFADAIPDVDPNVVRRWWSTNNNDGTIISFKTASPTAIINVYTKAFNLTPRMILHDSVINRVRFNVSTDDDAYKMFVSMKKLEEDKSEPSIILDMTYSNIWTFKNGKYYTTIEGKEVEYGDNDPATHKMISKSNKCYGTSIPFEHCGEFIEKCIREDDAGKLGECFTWLDNNRNTNFDNLIVDDIKKMHPRVAQTILKKFGFEPIERFSPEAGSQIRMAPSVNEWLKGLTDESIIKVVTKNTYLRKYLDHLVLYVNSNPAILNAGFEGPVVATSGIQKGYLSNMGVRVRRDLPRPISNNMKLMTLPDYANMTYMMNTLRHPFLPIFSVGTSPFMSGMVGGANNVLIKSSTILKELINGTISSLSKQGKSLNSTDQTKISKHLENLEKLEDQAYKIHRYLQLYKKYISITNNTSNESVSFSKLEDAVHSFNSIVDRRNTLEGTLISLQVQLGKILG